MIKQNSVPLALSQLKEIQENQQKKAALAPFNSQEVVVRGFVYQAPDGRWLLASTPDLKTCCLGSAHRIGEQIVLESQDVPFPIGYAVTLRGTFHIDPIWNAHGECVQMYCLKDVAMVSSSSSGVTFSLWIVLVAVVVGIWLWIHLRTKTRNKKITG